MQSQNLGSVLPMGSRFWSSDFQGNRMVTIDKDIYLGDFWSIEALSNEGNVAITVPTVPPTRI